MIATCLTFAVDLVFTLKQRSPMLPFGKLLCHVRKVHAVQMKLDGFAVLPLAETCGRMAKRSKTTQILLQLTNEWQCECARSPSVPAGVCPRGGICSCSC